MSLRSISDNVELSESKKKEQARKTSIKEGAAYSISEGFGMQYITPYALSMNANNTEIGILRSLPQLLGTFAQILTLKKMVNRSRTHIVFFGVLIQAILWLALIGVGIFYFIFKSEYHISPLLLIFVYTLLIGFGTAVNPAWQSWMKDVINENQGSSYFGNRNRILGFVLLLSMLISGFILDYFKQTYIFIGFIILFTIAFIGRSISAYLLTKQYEPYFKPDNEYYFTFRQFIKKMPFNNFGRFVLFHSALMFAASIASPFCAVYLLKNLNFSYLLFTISIIIEISSRLFFMPIWGKLADKYGTVAIIKFTAKIIPFVILLWFFIPLIMYFGNTATIIYIFFIQLFSGFIWSGFDLSSSTFIYNAVSRERMALCVSYHSILTNIGLFIGTIIGGVIATFNFSFWFISPIIFVFGLSFILRFLIAHFLLPKFGEVRKDVKEFKILLETEEKLKMYSPKNLINYIHFKFKP